MAFPYFFTWAKQSEAPHMEISGGMGAYVLDGEGRKIFDISSLSFQATLGHNHPQIQKAIIDQTNNFSLASPKATFPLKLRATEKLLKFMGHKVDGSEGKIFYTVSGAESVENALKVAREYTQKKIVLARKKSYHGATLGALSVTGDWRREAHFTVDEWTLRIPEPGDDPEGVETQKIVEAAGAKNIAAIIIETISGVNGVVVPPESWWRAIQKICTENHILLICDEVLAGFYRTGKAFAYEHFPVRPDLVCMSKGITCGYIPFGAVWFSPKLAQFYDQKVLSLGLTNYAHPLGLAVMEAVIDIFQSPAMQKHLQELISVFIAELLRLRESPLVEHINHKGLLSAVFLKTDKVKMPTFTEFWKKGLYVITKENALILSPPAVASVDDLKSGMQKLRDLIGVKNV